MGSERWDPICEKELIPPWDEDFSSGIWLTLSHASELLTDHPINKSDAAQLASGLRVARAEAGAPRAVVVFSISLSHTPCHVGGIGIDPTMSDILILT